MRKPLEFFVLALLCLAAISLIALQMKLLGWIIFCIGLLALVNTDKKFRNDIFLIYIALFLLGITPITTDISYGHFFLMGLLLSLAIAIPYTISKYIYKDQAIRFQFHHGRMWHKKEIFYVFLSAAIAYFLIPFFLRDTGSYQHWTVNLGTENLIRLFIGTNALGIWDELFFVSTVLGILRRFFTFPIANTAQAVLFTSFLYELGFRGWGFGMIFIFALIQGYIFKKTESLLYVITIHLTIDLILYFALIDVHHPGLLNIFI